MIQAGSLSVANYSVITPYLLPPGAAKRVNIGDGFILDSAIKLLGARPRFAFSSRAPLSDDVIAQLNETSCVIAAGANSLQDTFELAPDFTRATLARIAPPVLLMGVGHYGVAERTRGLSPDSVLMFRDMLARFPYMSVRCDRSRAYVLDAAPDLAGNVMMTSCPVVHRVDGVDRGFQRKKECELLVVTLTDRAHIDLQAPLLPAARARFPAAKRVLALHQDYGNEALERYAEGLGYLVFRGHAYEPFLELYARADLHFGNRVHAHLKCLSLGVASFCTNFSLRQAYFAESLDFPILEGAFDPEIDTYDFSRAAARRDAARVTMDRFAAAVRALWEAKT